MKILPPLSPILQRSKFKYFIYIVHPESPISTILVCRQEMPVLHKELPRNESLRILGLNVFINGSNSAILRLLLLKSISSGYSSSGIEL